MFWSYAGWFVPHGDHVELRHSALQVADSGWYVVLAVAFVTWAMLAARQGFPIFRRIHTGAATLH